MERFRKINLEQQMSAEFQFEIGDEVEVADQGKYWEAKVWKVLYNAKDTRLRYFCRFPGHPEWQHVQFKQIILQMFSLINGRFFQHDIVLEQMRYRIPQPPYEPKKNNFAVDLLKRCKKLAKGARVRLVDDSIATVYFNDCKRYLLTVFTSLLVVLVILVLLTTKFTNFF